MAGVRDFSERRFFRAGVTAVRKVWSIARMGFSVGGEADIARSPPCYNQVKPHRNHFFDGLPLVGMCRYDITLSVSSVASLTASLLRAITPATKPSIKASTAMLELVSTG